MRMRAAHGTISDIKMVVHQQYEWITEREVLWRDDWRCQVPWSYEPGGEFRNVINAADTALVQHPYLLSRALNVVCLHDLVPGSKRSRSIADETSGKQLSLHELGVQGDGNVVTHQNSAGLKGSVPGQTEVLAIDLGARRDPNPGVPPGILGRRCWPFHRKADFA